MRTVREAALLIGIGALLSLVGLAIGGRVAPGDLASLQEALDEQRPVLAWSAAEVHERLGPELLVVDGRAPEAHEADRPKGSMNLPFGQRHLDLFPQPEGRQVDAVLVVADDNARELARWIAREWGVSVVATLEGGWAAWLEAGLPR